jgi:hypothetical protein
MMDYEHTQKSPLGWILAVTGGLILIITWLISGDQIAPVLISFTIAVILVFVSLCFGSLTVHDERDSLAISFGPLPIFRTRIEYSEITEVQIDRSNMLDGWGIHCFPGRGWTYNVWGFDCIRIQKGKKIIRVGTDDKEALFTFLKTRIRA